MSAPMATIQADRWSAMQSEEKLYRRVYLASFVLFLAVATLMRLIPGQAGPTGERKSILAEARATAHATLGFALTH